MKGQDIHPAKLTLLVLVPNVLIGALLVLIVLLISPESLT